MALLAVMPVSASAQIATDGSLGAGTTGALPPGLDAMITIPAELGTTICNDANTSCNVFHSFSEFNINAGQIAAFTGPAGIDPGAVNNVLARVTGPTPSNIDGVLRTSAMPNANFFLMNPNGVVFGPGAQLDIGGSFVVTTADELRSTDGGRFSATTDPAGHVLTTAAPDAFGFLSTSTDAPKTIEVNGGSLEVGNGRALTMIGGHVHLRDGQIHTAGGPAYIIATGSVDEVGLDPTGDALGDVDLASLDGLGDVSLTQSSRIDLGGPASAGAVIRASTIRVENSSIEVGTAQDTSSGQGALVDIQAAEALQLASGGQILSRAEGSGAGVDLRIEAPEISIVGDPAPDDQAVKTGILSTASTGTGATIWVEAQTLDMSHHAAIEATTSSSGTGGDVTVDAGSISMSGRSTIAARTLGAGNAGAVTVVADDISISEASTIAVLSLQSQGGTTGDLTVDAGRIEVFGLEGSNEVFSVDLTGFLSRTGVEASHGGDILITAGSVRIADRGVINASTRSSGPSGEIQISGRDGPRSLELIVENGGVISSNTLSSAGAGLVHIQADTVQIVGVHRLLQSTGEITDTPVPFFSPSLVGTISFEGGGDAGNVTLEANDLTLLDGGLLTAFTEGNGDGGDINVTAGRVFLSGFNPGQRALFQGLGFDPGRASSSITTTTGGFLGGAEATGRAGDINITAALIELSNHGRIASASTTTGDAGKIELNADRISIHDDGIVSAASTRGTGDAGRIEMNTAHKIELEHRGVVRTSSQFAHAGGIALTVAPTGEAIILINSTVSAEAAGDGGNIKLTAPDRVQLVDSTLTARAGGDGGRDQHRPPIRDPSKQRDRRSIRGPAR